MREEKERKRVQGQRLCAARALKTAAPTNIRTTLAMPIALSPTIVRDRQGVEGGFKTRLGTPLRRENESPIYSRRQSLVSVSSGGLKAPLSVFLN